MSPTTQREPYLGPEPFTRDDEERFHGREADAQELYSLVLANQLTVLYGKSGTGKSSLLEAGVRPLLMRRGFDVLPKARVIDPALPVEEPVDGNVFSAGVLGHLGGPGRHPTIAGWLEDRSRGTTTPTALLVDQVEELFTRRAERWVDRQPFLEDLGAALRGDARLRVVLAMREEHLAELEPYLERLPDILVDRFLLRPLTRDGALAAVEEPARLVGWRYEDDVAARLVDDLRTVQVETRPGRAVTVPGELVEPVQLQVVCQRLWRFVTARPGRAARTITDADRRAFADVGTALAGFFEDALAKAVLESGVDEWRLRRWFELQLITPAGTRGLVYRGPGRTGGIPNAAVEVLEREHLIRGDGRAGAEWYELVHDRMIQPIVASNARARASRPRTTSRLRALAGAGLVLLVVGAPVVALLRWPDLAAAALKSLAVLGLGGLPLALSAGYTRTRLPALWDEYVLDLYRLRIDEPRSLPEPPESSPYHVVWAAAGGRPDDVDNVYLRKFESRLGSGVLRAVRGYGRFRLTSDSPVGLLACCLLLATAWYAVLRPDLGTGWPAVWQPVAPVAVPTGATLPSAVLQAAVLGGSLTASSLLVRDYLRWALTPGSFARASGRLLLAAVLGGVVGYLWPSGWGLGPAVTVGLVLGWGGAGLLARGGDLLGALQRVTVPQLRPQQLRSLEGLTAWDERRLHSAGVEDLLGLATANIVDLLLDRFPAARLVDWIDQAHLLLRLPADDPLTRLDRGELRRLGIRTATDVLTIDSAMDLGALGLSDATAASVRVVATRLAAEPGLEHVRAWRERDSRALAPPPPRLSGNVATTIGLAEERAGEPLPPE